MAETSSNINNINNENSPCVYDSWDNHLGAYFLDNGRCFFKLFTFPDVLVVKLEVKPKSRHISVFDMKNTGGGIWEIVLDKGIVSHGDRYRFVITDKNGEIYTVKDPCSMHQEEYFKWSKLYNHSLYNWSDSDWMCNKDSRKISRLSNEINKLSNVQSLLIYEMHIGTFTQEGTFLSAAEKLSIISEKFKFNAIEIMPVENTYSFNWGYDGVDKYAPNHTYGTPDDLKTLINTAHNLGLNVIMDIVPNHIGPDISELHKTGPYTDGVNCFGYKFNYEKKHNLYVRDFMIGAALNWLINYHCDGLRVDMTKFMCSDYTMKQLAAEVNYHKPDAFLIAEDGRDNDLRITRPFSQIEKEENELNHVNFINKIRLNKSSLSNLGYDTEWDFLFHKQIAACILGSWDCRIKNLCNFDYSLKDAQTRVKYIMSHDEIGNIDGTRLISKIMVNELKLNDKICDCCHSEKCKRIAHAAHKILISLVTGELESMPVAKRMQFYSANYLKEYLPVNDVYNAYIKAVNMHKLALGKVYSLPGPKMVFQGDESANLSYFKFFRKFSFGPEPYLLDKGYAPGYKAFLDSKLNSVKVCEKYSYINSSIENYMSDLNSLCRDNISLCVGNIEKTIVHEFSDTHAVLCKGSDNQIFSISNFSGKSYLNNYGILFPKGKWEEVLNSDNIMYAGTGEFINNEVVQEPYKYISLPAYGIVFFRRVG